MDKNQIYTVSELTKEIKTFFQELYPFVWVTGEISNIAMPSSGHAYFSLKDNDSLINCVIFKNQKKRLNFNIDNGIKITGIARLSIYEPRGTYQLIFEHIESKFTIGPLQARFEILKKELELEGLFDIEHKKELPVLPSSIIVITSPTGAVIKDIINISKRRFAGMPINIIPVKVQGEDADIEIKNAIESANKIAQEAYAEKSEQKSKLNAFKFDKVKLYNSGNSTLFINYNSIIIVARGGGSIEDLAPFNSEIVARAVFNSKIPIISAVGHETDFTICDFAADLRAPTPSAAAELAVPEYNAVKKQIMDLQADLCRTFKTKIDYLKQNIEFGITKLNIAASNKLEQDKFKINTAAAKLEALNPISVLERGYSITQHNSNKILTNSADTVKEDIVEVILSKGRLICKVIEIIN